MGNELFGTPIETVDRSTLGQFSECDECERPSDYVVELKIDYKHSPEVTRRSVKNSEEQGAGVCEEHWPQLLQEISFLHMELKVLRVLAEEDPDELYKHVDSQLYKETPLSEEEFRELSESLDEKYGFVPYGMRVESVSEVAEGVVVYCEVCDEPKPEADSLYEHMMDVHGFYSEGLGVDTDD